MNTMTFHFLHPFTCFRTINLFITNKPFLGNVSFRPRRNLQSTFSLLCATNLTTTADTAPTWRKTTIGRSSRADLLRELRQSSPNEDKLFVRTARMDSTNRIHNVPLHIEQLIGTNLHLQPRHPLHTIKTLIEKYFTTQYSVASPTLDGPLSIDCIDSLSPIVSVRDNFDELLFPQDHVGRRPSDTYYITTDTLLRTHTSAHQTPLMKRGLTAFLVTGDVYRRDAIDVTHFPVFHQMEGVRIFTVEELVARSRLLREKWTSLSKEERHAEGVRVVEADLKQALIGMIHALFDPNTNTRWVDAYFPFTTPSFELEIFFNSKWLEVLGSGIIHPLILRNCGYTHGEIGWAFGLGLERLALVLFDIPDIRLFWSKGTLVEDVELISEYEHPTTKRKSLCFRINYRSMERNLTNNEVDELQDKLRSLIEKRLGVQLR